MKKISIIAIIAIVLSCIPAVRICAKFKPYQKDGRILVDGKIKGGIVSGKVDVMLFEQDPSSFDYRNKYYWSSRFDRVSGSFTEGEDKSFSQDAVLELNGLCSRQRRSYRPGEALAGLTYTEELTAGTNSGGLTYRGPLELHLSQIGSYYKLLPGGTVSMNNEKASLTLRDTVRVFRTLYEDEISKWDVFGGIVEIKSEELCRAGLTVYTHVNFDILYHYMSSYSFPMKINIIQSGDREGEYGISWELSDNSGKYLVARNLVSGNTINIGWSDKTGKIAVKEGDTGYMVDSHGGIASFWGKVPAGDGAHETANVDLEYNNYRIQGKIIWDDGVKYEGRVYIVKNKKDNRHYSECFPSLYANDPLYFKKLTVADNIVFVEGTRYGPDGNVEETYKEGWSNIEIEAARNKAAIAKQEEQRKQAQARAEKEKNTKATQAFLNSAWGKKFKFNGYGDQYGNYNHGSSVLTFSSNHSDIWLDIAGTTTHFKIDHINGEDIWVKDIFAYVSAVTITPIKRNGKQAFKVSFYSLDTTYILY